LEPLRLLYRGLPLELTPVTTADGDDVRVYGYGITCPWCGRDFFLNTGIGRKPDHHIARNTAFLITILPPIRCPFKCGWAVKVIDSVAYPVGSNRLTDLA
jgi:hypothetical protein